MCAVTSLWQEYSYQRQAGSTVLQFTAIFQCSGFMRYSVLRSSTVVSVTLVGNAVLVSFLHRFELNLYQTPNTLIISFNNNAIHYPPVLCPLGNYRLSERLEFLDLKQMSDD